MPIAHRRGSCPGIRKNVLLSQELCRILRGWIDIRKGLLMKNFESCMAMVATGEAISPMPRSFRQENQNELAAP